jgi:hypothetical protein
MARYQLRDLGVYDAIAARTINRSDGALWQAYRLWLAAGNTPDPAPIVTPPAPSAEELAQAAELAEREQLRTQLRADAAIRALATRSPAQVDQWLDTNVTSLASAREVLKILARVIAYLARQHLPPLPPQPPAPPPGLPPP